MTVNDTARSSSLELSKDRKVLRIGTRGSQLALWQSQHIAARLEAAWPGLHCELHTRVTQGDRRLDRPLPEIGGKGLFTAELEDALRGGEFDIAVHSLKDLPVADPPGLTLGAVTSRADVRDVLIAHPGVTLATLPAGANVGTSSLRRQAQLAAYRPDLVVRPIRGNVDTRLRKVLAGEYDAAVMAAAGIARLGLESHVTEWLDLNAMLPAPGQGALGIQCRADDEWVLELLTRLEDVAVRRAVTAERQLLYQLGGGCSAPIAAYATTQGDLIHLTGRVAALDGAHIANAAASGSDPSALAEQVAGALLAQGAGAVLSAVGKANQVSIADSPLHGTRVLVTRAVEQADELVSLLEQNGAEVVRLPLITTVAVEESQLAVVQPDATDWILFTSSNAVRHFLTDAPGRIGWLAASSRQTRVAAIGPATTRTLAEFGVAVDCVPEAPYSAATLLTALGDVAEKSILLPRSAIAAQDLPNALRSLGASVTDLPVYTTVTVMPPASALADVAAGGPIDAICFTSPSTVRAYLELLARNADIVTTFALAVPVSIGPTTSAALQEVGLGAPVTAQRQTAQGLVDALIAWRTSNIRSPR